MQSAEGKVQNLHHKCNEIRELRDPHGGYAGAVSGLIRGSTESARRGQRGREPEWRLRKSLNTSQLGDPHGVFAAFGVMALLAPVKR